MSISIALPDNFTPNFPILGIDPGGTTGLSLVHFERKVGKVYYLRPDKTRVVWPEEADTLDAWLNEAGTLVVEDFRIFEHKAKALIGNKLPAPRVIGFVEGLMAQAGRTKDIHWYMSSIKTQTTDAFLYRTFGDPTLAGLAPTTRKRRDPNIPSNGHERDAFRLVVHYLIDQVKKLKGVSK